ncbi:MAG TPA: NAD(P)H-hydrate dehydratase, partial [Flavobacterium sp.]|nr:NAD(P)H-hydrate dehydratase [Flavobacterium sp.]
MKPIPFDKKEARKSYKPIPETAHKGTQGHALLIGGSYGKMGSITLSSKAAIKSGCGLVTAFIPECGVEILQISIPEVMIIADKEKKYISGIDFKIKPQA